MIKYKMQQMLEYYYNCYCLLHAAIAVHKAPKITRSYITFKNKAGTLHGFMGCRQDT